MRYQLYVDDEIVPVSSPSLTHATELAQLTVSRKLYKLSSDQVLERIRIMPLWEDFVEQEDGRYTSLMANYYCVIVQEENYDTEITNHVFTNPVLFYRNIQDITAPFSFRIGNR